MNPPAPTSATPTTVSKRYYIFIITYLELLSAFGSFVNDLYIPSLPEMVRYFHTTRPSVQLGLTFGMIGLGIGQIVLGPLSDRFGRKPVLIASLIVFCIGAVGSIWSPTIHVFVMWRLVQGAGASGGYFLARTIPADLYAGRTLAKVLALVGAINGFAPASAPILGGFIDKAAGWHGIFWVLAAFSVLLIFVGIFFKESLPKSSRTASKMTTAFKNYAVLARNRRFMIHVTLKGAALGMLFAYISSAPFIIQDHYGFDQLQFGLFMGFNALFAAAGSMFSLRFKPLKKAAVVAGVGLAFSVAIQVLCFYRVNDIWVYDALNLPMLFSLGMIFSVSNTLAMNEGRQYAGDASAFIGVAGYVFGAVVSPLVGIGNQMHSTALVLAGLTVITLIFSYLTNRLPADLDTEEQNPPKQ
ncbi:MAG: multidrug effflux MFS transporter [Muribaculaceae bacterium]